MLPLWRQLVSTLVLAVLGGLFVRTFLVQVFEIPTASMEPGLQVGDQVVVNKLVYARLGRGRSLPWLPTRDIRRGDVVVFRGQGGPSSKWAPQDFVKRCVGLPGETVEIADSRLFVEGRLLDEPYVHFSDLWRDDSFGPYRVPDGTYFCLGDHRDRSLDSRALGPVPASFIRARAWVVYWSFAPETAHEPEEWGMIKVLSTWMTRCRWGRCPRWVR